MLKLLTMQVGNLIFLNRFKEKEHIITAKPSKLFALSFPFLPSFLLFFLRSSHLPLSVCVREWGNLDAQMGDVIRTPWGIYSLSFPEAHKYTQTQRASFRLIDDTLERRAAQRTEKRMFILISRRRYCSGCIHTAVEHGSNIFLILQLKFITEI